jgi:hypothetical protein
LIQLGLDLVRLFQRVFIAVFTKSMRRALGSEKAVCAHPATRYLHNPGIRLETHPAHGNALSHYDK